MSKIAIAGWGIMLAGAVLWLYGADAVGKSAVGWEVYTLLADAEIARGIIDRWRDVCVPAPPRGR